MNMYNIHVRSYKTHVHSKISNCARIIAQRQVSAQAEENLQSSRTCALARACSWRNITYVRKSKQFLPSLFAKLCHW